MSPHDKAAGVRGARFKGLRSGLARLIWGVCALAALVLAGAVLLVNLRADEGATPWRQWFSVADLLTPGPVASLEVTGLGFLGSDAWADGLGWAVGALAWLFLGALLVWLVRPGRERSVTTTHTRGETTTSD